MTTAHDHTRTVECMTTSLLRSYAARLLQSEDVRGEHDASPWTQERIAAINAELARRVGLLP